MFSFPLLFFIFHTCPVHFSFFKHPLFSLDTEEEEEEAEEDEEEEGKNGLLRLGADSIHPTASDTNARYLPHCISPDRDRSLPARSGDEASRRRDGCPGVPSFCRSGFFSGATMLFLPNGSLSAAAAAAVLGSIEAGFCEYGSFHIIFQAVPLQDLRIFSLGFQPLRRSTSDSNVCTF